MYDPANRHSHATNMLANSNRLLNHQSTKQLTRPSSQQPNFAAKKLKTNHINGGKLSTTNDEQSTARSSKNDASLRCPLRQTLPIFKQPVTYYPTQRDEVKLQIPSSTTTGTNTSSNKLSEKNKPKQLFWEKRFEHIRPTDIDGQPFEHFKLPEQIKGVGVNMSSETVVISLATSLHLYNNSRALFGQSNQFSKNPTAHIQRDQPLIEHVTITDEHIRAQEEKVNELRRRIQQTMLKNANVKSES